MLYDKPLKCTCGKMPKLTKNENGYIKYYCKCGLQTFFVKDESCARESWCATINNISKLKVRV